MPGTLCDGSATATTLVKDSKAYCEGMNHRVATNGATIGANPHAAGSDAANAWDLGWTVAQGEAGSEMTRALMGCCAVSTTKTIVA